MEAVIAVLRLRQHINFSASEFHPGLYDILLVEAIKESKRTQGNKKTFEEEASERPAKKTVKQLPSEKIFLDTEPCDALLTYLYKLTGGDSGGLKGKHAVFVPPSSIPNDDIHGCGALYCISVDASDKLNALHVARLQSLPAFFQFDVVLQTLNSSVLTYQKQTRVMLQRLHSWLQEQHSIPGKMNLLFSSAAEDRLKWSITNPAYRNDYSVALSGNGSMLSLSKEAHTRMLAIDKCDITKINPLFGSDLTYKCKVDKVAVNKFWGLGQPDYSEISSSSSGGLAFISDTATKRHNSKFSFL